MCKIFINKVKLKMHLLVLTMNIQKMINNNQKLTLVSLTIPKLKVEKMGCYGIRTSVLENGPSWLKISAMARLTCKKMVKSKGRLSLTAVILQYRFQRLSTT